jgi:hypothetical protein
MPTLLEAMLDQQAKNQQQDMGTLQQAGAVQSLVGNAQKAQREQAYRQDVAALGPNPTQEQLVAVTSKYAGPDKLMDVQQKSLDRKAQQEQVATQYMMSLQQRQDNLDEKKREFDQRATDAKAQAEFNNWYKTETLKNQQYMQGLTATIKQQGLQLQQDKIDAAKKEKEDKDIEGQINKTANRLKDVQPVMVAAHQLNDLLSQYTPDNIPGVGYLKNTDTGKTFLTKEGKDVSSSIKMVGNAILKAMSGTAVTAPEEVRQMAAQMADGRFDAKDFYIAWPKVSGWLNSQSAVATSGLTDPARQRLIERTGMNLDPIKPRYGVKYDQGGNLNLEDSYAAPTPPPGFKINK